MTTSNSDAARRHADGYIARNAQALAQLGDAIFYFGELGMQEHRTSALLATMLERGGFQVERGVSGFPTGFLATWGSGKPVIAFHTEYDANPGNSQVSGRTERAEIVPGAPGHCEGHNVNAAVVIAAALAVKSTLEALGVPGTIKVFGAPAEEQIISRPFFVRDGHFDDVDLAFHAHIFDEFATEHGVVQLGLVSTEFTFRGVSAHSAMSPWNGRDALDAVVLMDMGMAQYREHLRPGMSAHRVITEGGAQPNVIPAQASTWWFFRDRDAEGVRDLFEQARRIAKGAAMMTNTDVEVHMRAGTWPVRCNEIIARAIQNEIERVGMPVWTAEEQAFARDLQTNAKLPPDGLRAAVRPLRRPEVPMAASNDCGDVSWRVPMGRVWFPSNIPHAAFHHWSAGCALTTSIAHKGAVAGTRALAGAAMSFFLSEPLVREAQETFRTELAGARYRPLIPDDLKPPVDLNRTVMDRYRPAMEKHYSAITPEFR
jgi:aminobenzoyl-glutamate utilization protein B